MLARARLVHLAPALVVVALSAVLAIILAVRFAPVDWSRVVLTVVAVAGSQVLAGAMNDWADRGRDAIHQPSKPIPSGAATSRDALVLAALGAAVQLTASTALGPLPLALGVAASLSALAYDLWLSRTPASALPFLVSFGLLPLWIASGVGVGLEQVASAALLAVPFATAAHLANVLRDYEADAAEGSRNLAQVLGPRRAHVAAVTLALAAGLGAAAAMVVAQRLNLAAIVLGGLGLGAVIAGLRRHWLWPGILLAALCWSAAWALGGG